MSVWQHVNLSEQICPWDTLACCWDVKQASNHPSNQHTSVAEGRGWGVGGWRGGRRPPLHPETRGSPWHSLLASYVTISLFAVRVLRHNIAFRCSRLASQHRFSLLQSSVTTSLFDARILRHNIWVFFLVEFYVTTLVFAARVRRHRIARGSHQNHLSKDSLLFILFCYLV